VWLRAVAGAATAGAAASAQATTAAHAAAFRRALAGFTAFPRAEVMEDGECQ
jgi:hypothetical protein